MKKVIQSVIAAMAIVALPLSLYAAGGGPEFIDLKEAFQVEGKKKRVLFKHHQHQAKLSCDKCHKNPNGGGDLVVEIVNKKGSRNDFHKKLCWPCHKEMSVPRGTSCNNCHK